MATDTSLPPGQFRFTELGKIGAGGLGEVSKIRIIESNCPTVKVKQILALKRLNEKWRDNETVMKRFEREIAMLKEMEHDNIIPFIGENLDGEARFYVMPLYGDTLRNFIRRGTWTGDWPQIASCGAVLADALHYAHTHANRYVHRDLKPENILFNPGGPLVIADWGIGKFVHKQSVVLTQLTRGGGMGTEYYCALEQWAAGEGTARSDIYSLGMTLDEWATGVQRELSIPGFGVTGDAVDNDSSGARAFNRLIREMTTFEAANRPDSMRDVAQRLRRAIQLG